ncbi:unnamed protein product [Peniophora sp. CBMAI 1063]|nr:unnamed protein product [Peniophora sp. CBMAI 1063]
MRDLITVSFIGSGELKSTYMMPILRIRKPVVWGFLLWSQKVNPLYEKITLDHNILDEYPEHDMIPGLLKETFVLNCNADAIRSMRKNAVAGFHEHPTLVEPDPSHGPPGGHMQDMVMEKFGVTDPNLRAQPGRILARDAFRKLYKQSDNENTAKLVYLLTSQPEKEYANPKLLAGMFPLLFPYGIGLIEDPDRRRALSLAAHIRALMESSIQDVQTHNSFSFVTWNMISRRLAHLHSKITVSRRSYDSVARDLLSISPESVLHAVSFFEHNAGVFRHDLPPEVQKALHLLRQVRSVTSCIPGSEGAKHRAQSEIRGYSAVLGVPHLFITLNVNAMHSPVFQFMCGDRTFNFDTRVPVIGTNRERAVRLADNPVMAARFFDFMIRSIFSALFGWDFAERRAEEFPGILGPLSGWYGTAEYTNRGALHGHFLLWLLGGLNPSEIHKRLTESPEFEERFFQYLESIVSYELPDAEVPPALLDPKADPRQELPHWPPSSDASEEEIDTWLRDVFQPDLVYCGENLQRHECKPVCFKYGSEQCRFHYPHEIAEESKFDRETLSVVIKVLDATCNPYNKWLLGTCRHNIDVKYILSGKGGKAGMFYIAGYITKSELSMPETLGLFHSALMKIDHRIQMPEAARAKALLSRCIGAMTHKQTVHAQQCARYLLGEGDTMQSHPTYVVQSRAIVDLVQRAFKKTIDHSRRLIDERASKAPSNEMQPDSSQQEQKEDDDDIDEDDADGPIEVSVDIDGQLVHASQAMNYYYRGPSLESLSFMEFACFCTVEEIKPRKRTIFSKEDDSEETEDNEGSSEGTDTASPSRKNTSRSAPRRHRIVEPHPLASSHVIVDRIHLHSLGPGEHHHLPRFAGPIPTPGSQEAYWLFMLSHFKPFSVRRPLLEQGEDIQTVYETYPFGRWTRLIIRNLDAIHECKDERDRQYMSKNKRLEDTSLALAAVIDDATAAFSSEGDVSLQIVGQQFTRTRDKNVQEALLCLLVAGWLRSVDDIDSDISMLDNDLVESCDALHTTDLSTYRASDIDMRRWPKEIKEQDGAIKVARRNRSNLALQTPAAISQKVASLRGAEDQHVIMCCRRRQHKAQILPRAVVDSILSNGLTEPEFSEDPVMDPGSDLALTLYRTATQLLDAVAVHNHLNDAQRIGFLVIARQWMVRQDPGAFPDLPWLKPCPLRILLLGPGGTGKTHCLGAVKDVMEYFDCGDRLTFYAPTGSAAINIGGVTLHKGYGLQVCRSSDDSTVKSKDCVSVFVKEAIRMEHKDIDVQAIDEVSMLGCETLGEIEYVSRFSKEGKMDELFGGAITVFSGDFLQHGPIGTVSLYTPLVHFDDRNSEIGISQRIGRMVWAQLTDVVELTENMRMRTDPVFAEVVGHVRTRDCTQFDVDFLNERVMRSAENERGVDMSTDGNDKACVVVGTNLVRQSINMAKSSIEARAAGRRLYLCAARDTRDKIPVSDSDRHKGERTTLLHLEKPAGDRKRRKDMLPGFLPLYVGMPVIYKVRNLAVELGIANGSQGIVVAVETEMDASAYEVAKYALVKFEKCKANLRGLPSGVVPVLPVTSTFSAVARSADRMKSGMVSVTRSQLPLQPAFAITSHSAEGKTMPKVLVDFKDETDKWGFAPYVGISRVQRRTDLALMRPVTLSTLNKPLPPGLQTHLNKLSTMAHNTLVSHGFQAGDVETLEKEPTVAETLEASYKPKVPSAKVLGKRGSDETKPRSGKRPRVDRGANNSNRHRSKLPPRKSKKKVTCALENADPLSATTVSGSTDQVTAAHGSLSNSDLRQLGGDSLVSTPRTRLPGCLWTSNYTCAYDSVLMVLFHVLFEASDAWRDLFTQGSFLGHLLDSLSRSQALRIPCQADCTHSSCAGRAFDEAREIWRNLISSSQPIVFPREGEHEVYVDKLLNFTLYSQFDWEPDLLPSISCEDATCQFYPTPADFAERRVFPLIVISRPGIQVNAASPVRLDDDPNGLPHSATFGAAYKNEAEGIAIHAAELVVVHRGDQGVFIGTPAPNVCDYMSAVENGEVSETFSPERFPVAMHLRAPSTMTPVHLLKVFNDPQGLPPSAEGDPAYRSHDDTVAIFTVELAIVNVGYGGYLFGYSICSSDAYARALRDNVSESYNPAAGRDFPVVVNVLTAY